MSRTLKMFLGRLLLSIPLWLGVNYFHNMLESVFFAYIAQPYEEMVFVNVAAENQESKLELEANSAVSFKINRHGREKFLFKKEVEEILPIASLTKLMTSLVVLENPQDYPFSKRIMVSQRAADQQDVPVYSNLKTGEVFSVETLLALMIIYSSNDAAWTLSEVIGIDNFVDKMNQKAKELDLSNTHFVNPTGLDPEDLIFEPVTFYAFNYSTGEDLIELAKYLNNNHPLVFDISLKNGPYIAQNGISSLQAPDNMEILGGKTGYTKEAGACMFFVLKDSVENIFLNFVLGTASPEDRISEAQKLINWLGQ
jgi:D-alanyl-D-alanine carboxypeptidase